MSLSISTLGLPFAEGDQASNARRNATMCMSGKGSEIAAIPSTMPIPFYRCIESSSGFLADEVYFLAADGLSKKNIRRKHLHRTETDEEGGSFHRIRLYNARDLEYGQGPSNNIGDFAIDKLRNAQFENVPSVNYGSVMGLNAPWDSATETGDYVNASIYGSRIGFVDEIMGIITMKAEYGANQVVRVGFGMENAQNTIEPDRKMGMEACNGTGQNWQAVIANGITRSTSATSMPVAPVPVEFVAYRMYFNPATTSYKLSDNEGNHKLVTSNVPGGGDINPHRLFRVGLWNNNNTTKNVFINRLWFIARVTDTNWFDGPN